MLSQVSTAKVIAPPALELSGSRRSINALYPVIGTSRWNYEKTWNYRPKRQELVLVLLSFTSTLAG